VIPHGVRFPAERQTSGPRERIVLHVGAIQKRKNISRLVTAFEKLEPEWRLVLAGSMGYGAGEILSDTSAARARDRIRYWATFPTKHSQAGTGARRSLPSLAGRGIR